MNSSDHESSSAKGLESQPVLQWIESGARLQDRLEEALGPLGLSLTQLNVLNHLAEARGSLALSELAALLSCVRSNVTQLVDRLESEGFVRRLHDPSDRRTVRAELTAHGRKQHAAGVQAISELQAEVMKAIGPSAASTLSRIAQSIK